MGNALLTINAKGLYLDKYATFEAYFKEELGLSHSYCYNLMGSAKVNAQMSSIEDVQVKPLNEAQFRELIPVPEEKRVAAWKGALKLAGNKPVTAKLIRQAATVYKQKKPGQQAKAVKKPTASSSNLKTAFKLIDDIESLAGKNQRLLARVTALRKCLLEIGGK